MNAPSTPLLEIGRGLASGGDGRNVGEAACREALLPLHHHHPSMLLVQASSDLPASRVLAGITAVAGAVPILGATAPADPSLGDASGGVVVTAIASPELTVRAAIGRRVSHDWSAALDEALATDALAAWFGGHSDLWDTLRRQGRGAFLALLAPASPPDQPSRGVAMAEALRQRVARRVPVMAISTGDLSLDGGGCVFLGEQVEADGLLVALVETRLRFGATTRASDGRPAPLAARREAVRTALLRGDLARPALALLTVGAGRHRPSDEEARAEREALSGLLGAAPVLRLQDLASPPDGTGWAPGALVLGDELSEAARVADENGQLRHEVEQWFMALGQSNSALMRVNAELREEVASRQLAQEALGRAERQQRALLDGISDFAWLKGQDGRYLAVNRPLASAVGLEPDAMVGRHDGELFPPALAEKYRRDDREVMDSAVTVKTEEPFIDCAGVRYWVETIKLPWLDAEGKVAGLVGVSRDVSQRRVREAERWNQQAELERLVSERTAALQQASTALQEEAQLRDASESERRQLLQQLQQVQKMEAMGRLAASVAHDFNNVVAVILSGAAELGRDPSETLELAGEIQAAGERAARLTKQLLAFSRQQPIEPRTIDVDELVRGFEPMAARLAGKPIRLTLALASRAHVHADPGQVEQVLMNLVVNARDAMTSGGAITIATALAAPGDPEVDRHGPGQTWVRLSVKDTGAGMTEEVQQRIFEPFFTTKPKGVGTGLGLATVFGIVKQAGGFVSVQSAPGQGSTFRVHLPRLLTEGERLRDDAAGLARPTA